MHQVIKPKQVCVVKRSFDQSYMWYVLVETKRFWLISQILKCEIKQNAATDIKNDISCRKLQIYVDRLAVWM